MSCTRCGSLAEVSGRSAPWLSGRTSQIRASLWNSMTSSPQRRWRRSWGRIWQRTWWNCMRQMRRSYQPTWKVSSSKCSLDCDSLPTQYDSIEYVDLVAIYVMYSWKIIPILLSDCNFPIGLPKKPDQRNTVSITNPLPAAKEPTVPEERRAVQVQVLQIVHPCLAQCHRDWGVCFAGSDGWWRWLWQFAAPKCVNYYFLGKAILQN